MTIANIRWTKKKKKIKGTHFISILKELKKWMDEGYENIHHIHVFIKNQI